MSRLLRKMIVGASAMALLASAGCSRSELQDFSPPPSSYVETPQPPRPAESTELLGGPRPSREDRRDDRRAEPAQRFATMAPIPNPEDMSPAERAEVYGDKGDLAEVHSGRAEHAPAHRTPAQKKHQARPGRHARASASAAAPRTAPVTSRPTSSPARPAPVAPPASATPPAQPPQQTPPSAISPAKTPADQLSVAITPQVESDAQLAIPEGLAAGKQGVVVLLLPKTLLGRIKDKAAELGLSVASTIVDARATLTGEGYTIIPESPQTARLQADEATTFSWQVTPKTGPKGPLKAEVAGDLKGGDKPLSLSLGTVEQGVTPAATAATAATATSATSATSATGGSDSSPAPSTITVPPFGQVRTGVVVLTGLAILALIILAAILRAASNGRARDRRRRELRTMAANAETREAAAAAQVDSVTPVEPRDDKPKPDAV